MRPNRSQSIFLGLITAALSAGKEIGVINQTQNKRMYDAIITILSDNSESDSSLPDEPQFNYTKVVSGMSIHNE